MSDYIDRESAIKAMLTRYWDGKETLREIMNSVPAADVAPVIHEHWIKVKFADSRALINEGKLCLIDGFWCGSCGCEVYEKTPYCPQCGAKMDVETP